MSESTEGYLILKRDEEKVRQSPPPKLVYPPDDVGRSLSESLFGKLPEDTPHYFIKPLNEKWSVLLIDDTGGATKESRTAFQQWRLNVSKEFPILYFATHDEGWNYDLFTGGIKAGSLEVHYGVDYYLKIDLAELRYPDIEDVHIFFDENPDVNDALQAEIENSDAYQETIVKQYQRKNVTAFEVFDIPSETIAQLDEMLSVEFYNADPLEQVEKFKTLLGFDEMSWVSYHYESKGERGKPRRA